MIIKSKIFFLLLEQTKNEVFVKEVVRSSKGNSCRNVYYNSKVTEPKTKKKIRSLKSEEDAWEYVDYNNEKGKMWIVCVCENNKRMKVGQCDTCFFLYNFYSYFFILLWEK